jgi:RNA polymerase sigma factor (sigma-70 family)
VNQTVTTELTQAGAVHSALRRAASAAVLRVNAAGADNDDGAAVLSFCAAVLEHHVGQFRAAGKLAEAASVIAALEHGEFAYGRRGDVNLWDDVVLVSLVAARHDSAVQAFRRRFEASVAGWATRYAAREEITVEDFIADLLLPREKSGPRIQAYAGRGPLDGWLKQVFISLAHKRRAKRLAEVRGRAGVAARAAVDRGEGEGAVDPLERLVDGAGPPDERQAQHECQEKLAPVIAECMERVPQRERLVLQMAVLDGVPQAKLAQIFSVPEYKITRLKQAAIRSIVDTFSAVARRVSRLADEGARRCVELLLEHYPTA